MFYSQFILAKKGPLGTIWIAAHLERKLRKNQVADTDIGVSVDSILFPDVPIALRLSSHLLLGVVRIYSRKVNYLFDDCSEALLKVKQAFRSTAVDLPPEESTAPYHSITLPETFDLDDFELPDSDIFQGNYVDHHVSTREQITLQDNMEGVVYSTSQFGLDERFGDGDTSGLDLEEELLLDKVAATGHGGVVLDLDDPQASGQPMIPLKHDEDHEGMTENSGMLAPATVDQIGSPDHNSEFIDYAHAPCTPGLMEEPNLSIVQEASAFDDHLELEDHNLTESETIENLENACNKLDLHHGNKNTDGWSLVNDMNPETVLDMPAEENGYSSGAKEIELLNPQGYSPSPATAMEHISSEDTHLVYIPSSDVADPVKAIPQVSEFSDLQNGVIDNNEPGIHSIDALNVDGIEPRGVRLDEAESSPTLSHEPSSLQEPCGNVEKPCALSDDVALNTESLGSSESAIPETETCLVPKDSMGGTIMHVLQPCNSYVKPNILNPEVDNSVDPGLPSKELQMCTLETSQREELPHASEFSTEVQAEGCHGTDVTEPVLEETQELVPDSIADKQADFNKVDDQPGSVISRGSRLENLDSSELPAPEKLLSVPESVADLCNDLLVESTPDNAVSVRGDIGGAGVETISGKKRSFTESTLTVQSLNSVESFGMTYSKTGEIPDDDDLLSSILVGRRSSVLKLKSTPLPPPEITSMKRPRTVPRASASKRKVLMDDIMVLHGDMIRQQLTSTEGIRRMRKKAPCTRTEIWMIQKQFLEEEIFIESLFPGSSTELLSMHSQTFDLGGIRVCQDEKATSSEAANDLEFSMGPNVTKETGWEVSAEDMLLRTDVEEEPAEIPENQQVGEHLLSSQGCDTQVQMRANSDLPEPIGSEHGLFEERAEMEIDGQSVAVADAINSENVIVGNMLSMSASSEVQPTSFDKNCPADASLPLDESGVSPVQKLDTQCINMGASTIDIHSGNGIHTIEVSEKTDDSVHVVVTESNAGDKFLLEDTEGGASAAIREEIQMDCSGPAVEEIGKNDLGVVNDDEFLAAELDADDKNPTSAGAFNEESNVDSLYSMEYNVDSKSTFLNDGGYPGGQEFDPQSIVDTEIAAGDHASTEGLVDFESFDYTIDEHDTGFLNVDDDDIAEEDNDYMPSAEETRFLENSGWSSRTRAVAKYLQTLFDKEAENGRKVLPMDNLLGGKTRKEASRMFFEALVLKTRDYIHVEQGNPFDSINIKPGMKLMKSDF